MSSSLGTTTMDSEDSGEWNGTCSNARLSHLPPEMRSLIFSHLDTATKKNMRLVSREWKTLAEDQLKFRVVLSDETFEKVKAINVELPINTLIVMNFNSALANMSYTRCGFPKNVREIVLGPGMGFPGDSRRLTCPPFTVERSQPNQIDISWGSTGISGKNLQVLLNCNPYLESLKVTGSAFKGLHNQPIPDLSGIKLECLKTLDINFGHFPWIQKMNKNSVDPYVALLRNSYPSLETLKFSSTAFKADIKLFIAVLQCIANHSKTLKHVEVFHTTVYSLAQRNETGNWFSTKRYNELKEKLEKVNLDYLCWDLMRCGPNAGVRWKELESGFIRSQTNLRTLKIIVNGRSSTDWDMEGIVHAVENTLVDLEFHLGCFCDTFFDFALLKNCRQLRKLNVQIVRAVYGVVFGPTNYAKMYKSIQELPTSVQSLTLSHMVQDNDAEWMARNLVNLEELTVQFSHASQEETLVHQFLRFLSLPKFKLFNLCTQHCEKIILLCLAVPGLSNLSTRLDTKVLVDRQRFVMNHRMITVVKTRIGFGTNVGFK